MIDLSKTRSRKSYMAECSEKRGETYLANITSFFFLESILIQ